MSEPLTTAEQVMISAAAVVCLSRGGTVERRALAMLTEVLPDVMASAKTATGLFDATRPAEGVRACAVALVGAKIGRPYEDARAILKMTLEHFFEVRLAAAYTRWRNSVADAAGR